jgi:hypothetical protein
MRKIQPAVGLSLTFAALLWLVPDRRIERVLEKHQL